MNNYRFQIPLFTLLIILMVTTLGFSQTNNTHTVKKGETLYSIARTYELNINDLKEWNNLESNTLKIGQQLIISDPNKDYTTYLVKPGDTLFGISKKFNVSIAELKSWNDLTGNSLDVNQQIKIYTEQSTKLADIPDKPEEDTTTSIVSDSETDNDYYTVKSGDTLYDIAREHNMSITELRTLNDLESDLLQVGQLLTVKSISSTADIGNSNTNVAVGSYDRYPVRRGESLDDILHKFKMDTTEFLALNPAIEPSEIRSGLQITVLNNQKITYQNPYRTTANFQNLGHTEVDTYQPDEIGNPITGGGLYNPDFLSAAHASIELGKVVYLENSANGKGIYVLINDRVTGNSIKLSDITLEAISDEGQTVKRVKIMQQK